MSTLGLLPSLRRSPRPRLFHLLAPKAPQECLEEDKDVDMSQRSLCAIGPPDQTCRQKCQSESKVGPDSRRRPWGWKPRRYRGCSRRFERSWCSGRAPSTDTAMEAGNVDKFLCLPVVWWHTTKPPTLQRTQHRWPWRELDSPWCRQVVQRSVTKHMKERLIQRPVRACSHCALLKCILSFAWMHFGHVSGNFASTVAN